MRIGVVSDVHSNLPALEAVLEDMGDVDALWCLGDFVGYGPWPNECVALLREHGVVAIAGNHDLAAIGAMSTEYFNIEAARATEWTAAQLTSESRDFLASLTPIAEVDGITLAHGSPREPVWEYVTDARTALNSLRLLSTRLCFVGHSHIPSLFADENKTLVMEHMTDRRIRSLGAYTTIANPGSVGQPRDRDSRAAYLVYDTEEANLSWHRVEYDIAATQDQMEQVSLPPYFIERLSYGM